MRYIKDIPINFLRFILHNAFDQLTHSSLYSSLFVIRILTLPEIKGKQPIFVSFPEYDDDCKYIFIIIIMMQRDSPSPSRLKTVLYET